MSKGILLVANKKSGAQCENLIYSIRQSGCMLPIRLIHFGGREIESRYVLNEVEFMHFEDFSKEAQNFIAQLRSVLTDCPLGYLYRYLGWFTDWDEFIYSDNDIVALMNWEKLFEYDIRFDLIHADEEYLTKGIFNYDKPEEIEHIFGKGSLETAITAGHILVRKSDKMIADIIAAIEWFRQYPYIPKKHDQALLHIASLLGNWHCLNLCKPPHLWLSSWAGDYKNSLALVQAIQNAESKITHLHYSGRSPNGSNAMDELLYSYLPEKKRVNKLYKALLNEVSGFNTIQSFYKRGKDYFERKFKHI
ncbi:MAG: hypothetical protein PHH37_07645 [Paludibacter sp.]|nr:hypothetical protein [Paludibacter sp.]